MRMTPNAERQALLQVYATQNQVSKATEDRQADCRRS